MRTLLLALTLSLATGVPARAAAPLHLDEVLAALGDASVPAAWAGVWQFQEDDYDCTTNAFLGHSTTEDTLCAGAPVFGGSLPGWSCTGTGDDTSLDITCSGSEEIDTGCTVTFTQTLTATRSGDTVNAVATFSQTFSPEGCAFIPDSCTRTESVGTRLGPPPPGCTTATVSETWGRTKAHYR